MQSFTRGIILTAVWISSCAIAQEYEYDLPVREHMLDNGLRLLVIERPEDTRVSAKIFTDMGALNERSGEYGAAHFLEHLMFKGTRTLGTKDWNSEKPLIDEINATERALIEELNRARNELRQRGVFHDYQHASTTPELERLQARIDELEDQIQAEFAIEGVTMKWYQANGGTRLTAATEQEYMHFDIDLPANRVDIFLRIEADRMQNSIFRKFDAERMILLEQRYGSLNGLGTRFDEAMEGLVGRTSNVFVPEGYLTDFGNYTRQWQRELYETYFVPNNTTLIFIGGVTMDEMIPRVEHHFGHMKRAPEPMRYYGQEPPPSGEKRLIFRDNKLSPRVEFRFQIPGVGHPDRPHFDVLKEVIRNRLQQAVDDGDTGGAVNADTRIVHTSNFGLPASLNIEIVYGETDHLEEGERTALSVFSNLAMNDISADELRFAQKTLRTEWYRMAADPNRLNFQIGHFEVMDSWRTLKPYLEARDRTTTADIKRLTGQYFVADNRTTGVVIPRETLQ